MVTATALKSYLTAVVEGLRRGTLLPKRLFLAVFRVGNGRRAHLRSRRDVKGFWFKGVMARTFTRF